MMQRRILSIVGFATLVPALCLAAELPLQDLALRTVGAGQGVYAVAGDGSVLASLEADRPVHPASVTKIATTIALLDRLGPAYRFETRFRAGGAIEDGTVRGGLVVEASGDPFLIFESTFLVLAELRAIGVRRVEGGLRVEGPLLYNWEPDPRGERLLRTLSGRDGGDAWRAAQSLRRELHGLAPKDLGLRFSTGGSTLGQNGGRALVVYRSPPLAPMLKALNGYSNNVFHLASDRIGGAKAVERIVRERVPEAVRGEIVIDNAAGAGKVNRMSPRAAVAIVQALVEEGRRHGLRLFDLLPVSGIDRGTLETRFRDEQTRGVIVGKTGTYGSLGACALAGVLRTDLYGDVTFAVLNAGLGVAEARSRQDAFVRGLLATAGGRHWDYDSLPSSPITQASAAAVR